MEGNSQTVSDSSTSDATATATATATADSVAPLRSGDVASSLNAPPRADSDHDTKTKYAISQIPTDIRNRNTFNQTWLEFPLTLDAHKVFLTQFRDAWGFGQLRHDYFAPTRKIALRMGTIIHTAFGWHVGDHVANDLRVRRYHPEKQIADFAAQLGQRADAPVDFADESGSWLSPDLAFAHVDAYHPGVVFEIAYSERKMPLQELAQEYIQGSDGEIQTVVAFEIEYPAAKRAKVLVWKKQEVRAGDLQAELVLEEEFQKADGTLNAESKGLHLSLRDFCPDRMIPEEAKPLLDAPTYLNHETGIHIPASRLCHYLAIAKTQLEMVRSVMWED